MTGGTKLSKFDKLWILSCKIDFFVGKGDRHQRGKNENISFDIGRGERK